MTMYTVSRGIKTVWMFKTVQMFYKSVFMVDLTSRRNVFYYRLSTLTNILLHIHSMDVSPVQLSNHMFYTVCHTANTSHRLTMDKLKAHTAALLPPCWPSLTHAMLYSAAVAHWTTSTWKNPSIFQTLGYKM